MAEQTTQTQPKPKIEPKTRTEWMRIIRIEPATYRMIRSFVESSTKPFYSWRMGYEETDGYTWIKRHKWELRVYKNVEYVSESEYEKLPVIGIYKVTKM